MFMIKFLVLVLLFVSGCSKDEDRFSYWGNQSENVLMPFYNYNTWTYVDSVFVSDISVHQTKLQITGSRVYTVDDEKKRLFFWNWYKVEDGVPVEPTNQISLLRNEDEGLYFFGQIYQGLTSAINQRLFLQYPTEEGNVWPYIMSNIFEVETISLSENVETDAGQFETIKYKVYDTSGRGIFSSELYRFLGLSELSHFEDTRQESFLYLYYTPDIGYVAMEEYVQGNLVQRKTLKSYLIRVLE